MIEEIKRLILLGQEILQLPTADESDRLVALLDEYLSKLDRLDLGAAASGIPRDLAEEFLTVHGELIGRSRLQQSLVLNEIGELQKRSQALRRYLDQSGERISITGKRKG